MSDEDDFIKDYNERRNETARYLTQIEKDVDYKGYVDFNAENYDITELAAILNFKYIPLNESIIEDRINKFKQKFKGKQNYIHFFDDVKKKLIKNLKKFNEESWLDAYKKEDSDAARVLQQQFQDLKKEEKENNNNHMLDIGNLVIGQRKLSSQERQAQKDFTQGTLNNIRKDTYTRIINFDSTYRPFLPRVSFSCQGNNITETNENQETRLYSSGDYIAHLSEPLKNVISIEVYSGNIPKSWFVFSKNYGTHIFKINTERSENGFFDIILDEGNYNLIDNDSSNLITAINNKIKENINLSDNGFGVPVVEFSYNKINSKIDISNNDVNYDISCSWYIPDVAGSCGGLGAGSKIDSNLGWLLGFREKFTTIKKNSKHNSNNFSNQGCVNTEGCSYLFITLDDFNNNKPSNVVIAATAPAVSGFKLPSYYNNETMNSNFGVGTYYPGKTEADGEEWACVDVADENNNERGCSTNDLNIDLKENLTQQQSYSISQILLAQNQSIADRYSSPEPTDLLYKVNGFDIHPFNKSFSFTNPEGDNKREYFGPVKLRKFRVKLINDKGYTVDLNNMDWSFSLKVTQKYQY